MQRGRELGFFHCLVGWEKQRKERRCVDIMLKATNSLIQPNMDRKLEGK